MKTTSTLACCAAILAGGSLVSCVAPYDVSGGAVVASTYQPGYTVTRLPSGYRTAVYGGTRYYYHNDTYYRPRGNGYVVVETPRGARRSHRDWDGDGRRNYRDPRPTVPDANVRVIRRLPDGYREVHHHGQRYYRYGNTYYQSRGSGFVIVASPF
ncbi:DUF6515 family protein [Luteolibacter marinus]|uniref:DUF6515 family protein n=1 Tax=Luteolibacter marinus TaxID=2776705 RepID=UPI001866F932|nr:DUF6515 family protein [Luteolibacter marinus]